MARDRSFSRQLETVTRNARHYMDEPTFDRVRKVVEDYAKRSLGAAVLDLFQYQVVFTEREGAPGLRPVWRSDRAFPIRYSDGGLSGQCAFCFDHQKPIWIVAEQQGALLHGADGYKDLWSNLKDIPPYLDSNDVPAKTLICVPVPGRRSRKSGITGVVNLEAESVLMPTRRAKREILNLATALHTLFVHKEQHDRAMEDLNSDLDELHSILSTSREMDLLNPPKLFFAYSADADQRVVGSIRQLLSDYQKTKEIDVVDWGRLKTSGNIDRQVLRHLGEAAYGICYLSKPNEKEPGKYVDSPSVLFEAGMLQARGDQLAEFQYWIPIREKASPPIPFDFLTQRMLFIPRLADKGVNTDSFEAELKARLDSLLSRSVSH